MAKRYWREANSRATTLSVQARMLPWLAAIMFGIVLVIRADEGLQLGDATAMGLLALAIVVPSPLVLLFFRAHARERARVLQEMRRRVRDHCPTCGYSIRGLIPEQRHGAFVICCPECAQLMVLNVDEREHCRSQDEEGVASTR